MKKMTHTGHFISAKEFFNNLQTKVWEKVPQVQDAVPWHIGQKWRGLVDDPLTLAIHAWYDTFLSREERKAARSRTDAVLDMYNPWKRDCP